VIGPFESEDEAREAVDFLLSKTGWVGVGEPTLILDADLDLRTVSGDDKSLEPDLLGGELLAEVDRASLTLYLRLGDVELSPDNFLSVISLIAETKPSSSLSLPLQPKFLVKLMPGRKSVGEVLPERRSAGRRFGEGSLFKLVFGERIFDWIAARTKG
jgi:hypothetical protein